MALISKSLGDDLQAIFQRHENVSGLSVAVINGSEVKAHGFGMANREENKPVTKDTLFQIASCSKTIGTFLMLKSGFSLDANVNQLLSELGSEIEIECGDGIDSDELQIRHLLNHTALDMHYVNGIPEDHDMPDITELFNGNDRYGYEPVQLLKVPGSKFKYSGGGFLLAQHLMDLKFGAEWQNMALNADIHFNIDEVNEDKYAMGYKDDGSPVRLMFPAFAAGMICTPEELAKFLIALRQEFKDGNLLEMLAVEEKGSKAFIGGKAGCGLFLFNAGENRFIGHHGANDGFRGVYLLCISGPHEGQGLVIFSNGEEAAIHLNADVCKHVLQTHFQITEGIDFPDVMNFEVDPSTPKECVVNFGMKSLVFDGFQDWSNAKFATRAVSS